MAERSAVAVRRMAADDIPRLVELFEEMQAYYRVPCPPAGTIARDLRDLPAGVTILVACAPGPIGFAAVASTYPGPGLRRGLFLKELFVSAASRRGGAGRALLAALASIAEAEGFARIDWTADREDTALLDFYRRTGAEEQPRKAFFRLSGRALAELAGT